MHLITRISVIGISLITAALVVVIAAFNGIEMMVERLYSDFDAPVIIRSAKGKTFTHDTILFSKLQRQPEVARVSRAIEEIVILKNESKRVNARMTGVDLNYLETCRINQHIVDGYPTLLENDKPCGIIGAVLLDNLYGWIPDAGENEQITVYTPLREASIGRMKSPFKVSDLEITARMNYNREVNAAELLVPLEFAADQLDYGDDISAYYIGLKPGFSAQEVKESLQKTVGSSYDVKTGYEKNELIFKTSNTEKKIVIALLAFIFVLAAFNLVASINMLYIQKQDDLETLGHLGASNQFLFRIFFLEGLLIAGRGIFFGLILGSLVCAVQIFGHVLEMPNSNGEAFPIAFSVSDGILVIALVGILSMVFSYLPVQYLIRRR